MRIKGGYYIVKYINYIAILLTLNINSQPYLLDTRLDTHAVLKHHESSSLTQYVRVPPIRFFG